MKTLIITALAVAGVLGTAATAMAVNADTVVSPDPVTIVSTDVPTPGLVTDPVVTPDPLVIPEPLDIPVPVPTTDATVPSVGYLDDDSDDFFSDDSDSDSDDSDSDDSESGSSDHVEDHSESDSD